MKLLPVFLSAKKRQLAKLDALRREAELDAADQEVLARLCWHLDKLKSVTNDVAVFKTRLDEFCAVDLKGVVRDLVLDWQRIQIDGPAMAAADAVRARREQLIREYEAATVLAAQSDLNGFLAENKTALSRLGIDPERLSELDTTDCQQVINANAQAAIQKDQLQRRAVHDGFHNPVVLGPFPDSLP